MDFPPQVEATPVKPRGSTPLRSNLQFRYAQGNGKILLLSAPHQTSLSRWCITMKDYGQLPGVSGQRRNPRGRRLPQNVIPN